jgi:hypothetical protein
MDIDLINAPDMLTVEKLKAQDYRNSIVASSNATAAASTREAARLAAYQKDVDSMVQFRSNQMAVIQAESAKLGPELTLRERIALEVAVKYMTASSSTVPATYQADAALDAARLKSAIDEVVKILT